MRKDNIEMSRVTRRIFLSRAMTGAGAVALPLLVTGKTLGLDGGVSANERIVMGMIGQGVQGRLDTQGFLCYPQVQIKTICDVVDKHAELSVNYVNKACGNTDCKTTWKFEDVLNDDKIDAVFIGTNEHWHTYIAVHAMRNGKDVYCEKPETLTVREGQLLRETARRYKRVFSGGSQRMVADYELFHKIIRAGLIGKVLVGHGQTSHGWTSNPLPGQPIPKGIHWDRWLGPAPWRPFNPGYLSCGCGNGWMDLSGGGLASWGAHTWGGIMYAMQLDYTGPTKIIPPGVGDTKFLTWEFANGMKIMEGNAWGHHPGGRKGVPAKAIGYISFTGELDTISEQDIFNGKFPIPDMDLEVYKGEPAPKQYTGDRHWYSPMLYVSGKRSIFGDFLHCVKTREEPFRNVERAHRVCSLAHLGNIALLLRREIRFDPIKEEIIGDETALRLLDRPRRSPWILDT